MRVSITFDWWKVNDEGGREEPDPGDIEMLIEAGVDRSGEMLAEGFREGSLNSSVENEVSQTVYDGWWRIERGA